MGPLDGLCSSLYSLYTLVTSHFSSLLGSKSLEQLANREHTRTYKLQKEDFRICLVRSIEEQARPIESRICRILITPK